MKIFGLVLGASILLAPAAHARTWVVENIQDATCDTLPADGVTDPADAANQIRQQIGVPQVQEINGPDGQLAEVVISFTQENSQPANMWFFTSMDGCQAQLKKDIADGDVTDPNSLK